MAKRRIKAVNGQRSGHDVKHEGRRQIYLFCAVLILATLIVYWQTAGFGFVNCDDGLYVENNHVVHNGLHLDALPYAFTTCAGGNWMPMVWMSYMVDHDRSDTPFGKEDPRPYHVTNVLLHVANALLLFLVLNAMTGSPRRSAFVAMLFAIHPLHVESVAWVAERKDTLSTLFWLLTMFAYLKFVRSPNWRRYGLMLGAFVLGIMSKPMLVSLPIVLLLMDIWPLRRLGEGGSSLPSLIMEKIPLLVISGIASVLAVFMQKGGSALTTLAQFPLGVRVSNAVVCSVAYMRKMFWPNDLAWQYPHPGNSLPVWQVVGSACLLAALTAGAIYAAKRRPYVTVGWFWYLIALLPVIGLVQVGHQAMADRYTYVPIVGLFIIAAWGGVELAERFHAKKALPIVAAVAILFFMGCAYHQVEFWRDSVSLCERAIDVVPTNSVAHLNLGLALLRRQPAPASDIDSAIEHLKTAMKLDPSLVGAEYGLGAALLAKGETAEATEHFERAVRSDPQSWCAQNALGVLLYKKGQSVEALKHLDAAIRACPDNENIRKNRDFVKLRMASGSPSP